MKFSTAVVALCAASVTGFSPAIVQNARVSTNLFNGPIKGAGGMHDTRDPTPMKHEDPRKSISEAPSFEEYLKSRQGGGAPAPAPAAAAPAAPAPATAAPAWGAPSYSAPAPAPAAPAWGAPSYGAPAPAPATPSWGAPAPAPAAGHGGAPAKGAGGMFDTRDPTPMKHEDPRKSIAEAPSFEEYMKSRGQ